MPTPILVTKLYIPAPGPKAVLRPRLIERLNKGLCPARGLGRKLTLISAPAGFGKTTLLGEWVADCKRPVAWLSLDEGDSDLARFLTYLVAALQTIAPNIGAGALTTLQSLPSPPTESILTVLLNEIAALSDDFILVLDDYHVLNAKPVDDALAFLLDHLPSQMCLVISTREDPRLPLARLRAQGQLAELRVADLRFSPSETAGFLNRAMGLELSARDISALGKRTEGWIAGLQLAALSIQGHQDAADFIQSFTGSHHFVLDYLVKEVLQLQSESLRSFLLRTSILDRLCGPLCDAVLLDRSTPGQETLERLEHSNLFIVPLDNERRWYRYHHLFADALRQLLLQSGDPSELHKRASVWYEDNSLEIEAFHHAAAANDVERAERLMEGGGMPLHFRGAVAPVLSWLQSLPRATLDANPSLWVTYASALSMSGQTTYVEEKLQSAEAALQGFELDDETRNLLGHIAAIRALLAAEQYQVETIIAQSSRALEYLSPDNLPVRTATIWKLGVAYQLQGNRGAAGRAYAEAISLSHASKNTIINILASTSLGMVQESENRLFQAAETYRRVLQIIGDPPAPAACEAYLGLARIYYEWNDLEAARLYGLQSVELARQIQSADRVLACEAFLARLTLARGDTAGAAAILSKVSRSMGQDNFAFRKSEVAAAQVLTLLRQAHLRHFDGIFSKKCALSHYVV